MPSGLTPAVDNALLQPGDTFSEALATDLAEQDEWNRRDGTVGSGTGIEATVEAFETAFNTGHSHNGDPGQGEPIPAAGIAALSVDTAAMFAPDAVTTAKIANTTVNTANLGGGAVTVEKMGSSASMGTAFSGSQAFDLDTLTLPSTDRFDGETKTITHGLGRRPVITNRTSPDFHVRRTTATQIVLGINEDYVTDGGATRSGSWTYGFRAC